MLNSDVGGDDRLDAEAELESRTIASTTSNAACAKKTSVARAMTISGTMMLT